MRSLKPCPGMLSGLQFIQRFMLPLFHDNDHEKLMPFVIELSWKVMGIDYNKSLLVLYVNRSMCSTLLFDFLPVQVLPEELVDRVLKACRSDSYDRLDDSVKVQ